MKLENIINKVKEDIKFALLLTALSYPVKVGVDYADTLDKINESKDKNTINVMLEKFNNYSLPHQMICLGKYLAIKQ